MVHILLCELDMKRALVASLLVIFLGLLFAGVTRDVSDSEAPIYTFGLEHVPPKIMLEAGTQLPNGTVLTESLATGGIVYGTVKRTILW